MFVSKKKFKELSDRLDLYQRELKAWKENRATKIEEMARLLKYKPAGEEYYGLFRFGSGRASIDLGSHIRTCLGEPNKIEDYEIIETPIVEPKKAKKK